MTLPAVPPTLGSRVFSLTGNAPALYIHVGSTAAVSAYTSAWGVTAMTGADMNTSVYGEQHKGIAIEE
jgi:hypothetical protein